MIKFKNIDLWIEDFLDRNNLKEKDILVKVFPQINCENAKIKEITITLIYEKNFEVVDVYFGEELKYTVYDPNDLFMEDISKQTLKQTESEYFK